MTNSNYTHILAIVDRSGSMFGIQDDMRGALNEFFKSQAKIDGKCLVDYVQFDELYDLVYTDKPVSEAEAVLEPRGRTALLDAVGKAVTDLGTRLAGMDEDARPGLVQVVVVTDGLENSSRDWTQESVKALIKQQEEDYSWDFVFLGANMDAPMVAQSFGIKASKAMTYDVTNTSAMAGSLSTYTTRSRLVGAEDNEFTPAERDAQGV